LIEIDNCPLNKKCNFKVNELFREKKKYALATLARFCEELLQVQYFYVIKHFFYCPTLYENPPPLPVPFLSQGIMVSLVINHSPPPNKSKVLPRTGHEGPEGE
jgi:hypothetical protein